MPSTVSVTLSLPNRCYIITYWYYSRSLILASPMTPNLLIWSVLDSYGSTLIRRSFFYWFPRTQSAACLLGRADFWVVKSLFRYLSNSKGFISLLETDALFIATKIEKILTQWSLSGRVGANKLKFRCEVSRRNSNCQEHFPLFELLVTD